MILLDENVPKSVYTELKKRNYDVKHVIFIKRGLKDKEVINIANRENRAIITLDEDFVHLSRFVETKIILIRRKIEKKKVCALVDILEELLDFDGKVAVIRAGSIRLRDTFLNSWLFNLFLISFNPPKKFNRYFYFTTHNHKNRQKAK